mgnify:CR=1 FL=1
MVHIFDDILSERNQNAIEGMLTDLEFDWHLQHETVSNGDEYMKKNPLVFDKFPSFHHILYKYGQGPTSDMCDVFKSILKMFSESTGIEVKEILRIRANLFTKAECHPDSYTIPHYDTYQVGVIDDKLLDHDFAVLIYYVNDSDGCTYIFDKDNSILKKIEPKKGRFILFHNCKHAGSFPREHKLRMVINFNLKLNL